MIDEDVTMQAIKQRTQEMRDRMSSACRKSPPTAVTLDMFGDLIAFVHLNYEVLSHDEHRTYVARTDSEKEIMRLLVSQKIMHRDGPAAAHFNTPYQRPKALGPTQITQASNMLNDYQEALKAAHQHTGPEHTLRSLDQYAAKVRLELITYLSNIERD